MDRRSALKNFGLITGGVLLFNSCDFSDEKVSIILNKLKIDTKEESLLKDLVATILPEGESPGGVTIKAHNFVWVIVDDTFNKEKQVSFMKGLRSFDIAIIAQGENKFQKLNAEQKLEALNSLSKNKDADKNILSFLKTTKQIAVEGYMNSEYFMTEQMPYKLVPGPFSYKTCKTINNNEKINING